MALQYVGTNKVTGNTGTLTLSLTALTGGIDTAARAGDFVLAAYAAVSTSNLSLTVGDGTWDSPTGLWANDSRDANLRIATKVMTATPDTQVQGSGQTTATNGAVMVCHVWRGLDTSTPLDVAVVSATGTNSALPNPDPITPVTANAILIAVGAGTGTAVNNAVSAPTGYTNLAQVTVDPGNSITCAIASKVWGGAGAEDPAAFGGLASTTSDGWAAYTLAIRPAAISDQSVTSGTVSATAVAFAPSLGLGAAGATVAATQLFASTVHRVTFDDLRQLILDHIVSAQGETNGWNATRANIPVTAVVRTSSTVITITLPALATYSITADEHITVTVPGEVLTGQTDIIATPTVDIANATGAQSVTGATVSATVVRVPTVAQQAAGATVSGTVIRTPAVAITVTSATISATVTVNVPSISLLLAVTTGTVAGTIVRVPSLTQNVLTGTVASTLVVRVPTVAAVIAGATISATVVRAPSTLMTLTAATVASTVVRTPALALTVTTAFVASTAQFYAASLLPVLSITAGTISSTLVLNAPTVGLSLTAGTVANTILRTPTLTQHVSTSTVTSTLVVWAPTLTLAIAGATVPSTLVVRVPTLTPLVLGATVAATILRAPTLTYSVTTATITATSLFTPGVATVGSVATGTVSSTVLYLATVTAVRAVTGATVSGTVTFAPATGLAVLSATIPSAAVVRAPAVAASLSGAYIASGAVLSTPTLTFLVAGATIAATIVRVPAIQLTATNGTVPSGLVIHIPSITGGLVTVVLPFIVPTTQVRPPTLLGLVQAGFMAASLLFAPVIAPSVSTGTLAPTSAAYGPAITGTATAGTVAATTLYGPSVIVEGYVYYLKIRVDVPFEHRIPDLNEPRYQDLRFEQRYEAIERV